MTEFGRVISHIAAAVDEVNATRPRTRYPWWRRLWWRLAGVPADVRAAQFAERKARAEIMLAALHRRRP